MRSKMASGNEDKLDGCLEVTHKFTYEDRLARPHFPREEHKPLLGFDPINQSSQSFHIDRVAIKESRVRRYAKWRLSKPKVTLNVFIQTKEFGHFLCLLYKRIIPTIFCRLVYARVRFLGQPRRLCCRTRRKCFCCKWTEKQLIIHF